MLELIFLSCQNFKQRNNGIYTKLITNYGLRQQRRETNKYKYFNQVQIDWM